MILKENEVARGRKHEDTIIYGKQLIRLPRRQSKTKIYKTIIKNQLQ